MRAEALSFRVIPMTRWEVLKEHIHDVRQLRNLAMLLRVIEANFDGEVKMQKDITEYMTKKYRWGNKSTVERLNVLVDLELLKCVRDPETNWAKTYYLLDA